MRKPFYSQVLRLAAKALASGATRVSVGVIEWDISRNCESPVVRELYARPETPPNEVGPAWVGEIHHDDGEIELVHSGKRAARVKGKRPLTIDRKSQHPLTVVLHTRCRRCRRCLRARKQMWALRAKAELQLSARTWFGTLTLNPGSHVTMLSRARFDLVRSGVDFETLSADEQFKLRHAEISKEITKFLKRVRAESGGPLRFLCIAEVHKSGLPHYHMLVHEVFAGAPASERLLRKQWTLGFSKWNLVVDQAQAVYLCKYLTKDALARVRASVRYGSGTVFDHSSQRSSERVQSTPHKTSPQAAVLRSDQ